MRPTFVKRYAHFYIHLLLDHRKGCQHFEDNIHLTVNRLSDCVLCEDKEKKELTVCLKSANSYYLRATVSN